MKGRILAKQLSKCKSRKKKTWHLRHSKLMASKINGGLAMYGGLGQRHAVPPVVNRDPTTKFAGSSLVCYWHRKKEQSAVVQNSLLNVKTSHRNVSKSIINSQKSLPYIVSQQITIIFTFNKCPCFLCKNSTSLSVSTYKTVKKKGQKVQHS